MQRREIGDGLRWVVDTDVGVLHRLLDIGVTGELLGLGERGARLHESRDVGVPPGRVKVREASYRRHRQLPFDLRRIARAAVTAIDGGVTIHVHPLVANRYCFALPEALWGMVYEELGADAFEPDVVELEAAMSQISRDHADNVGFRNGQAFAYPFSRQPLQMTVQEAQAARIGTNQAALDQVSRRSEEYLAPMAHVARAYAGWLMTNRQFLDEHDALLAAWSEMVRRWGLQYLGRVVPRGMLLPEADPTRDPRWVEYAAAFQEFFTRWHLQDLTAPYLPTPLPTLMVGSFPMSIASQVTRSGGAIVIPPIYPVPSRDTLRNALDDMLHGDDSPDHLAEWMALIASNKTNKTPLQMYTRQFEVQHYYRVLHHRHAAAIHRKLHIVKELLAVFFDTGTRTIAQDLATITERLGSGWVRRGDQFDFGPFGPA